MAHMASRTILKRGFSSSPSGPSKAYAKYQNIINENKHVWEMLFPQRAGPGLRFFSGQALERESLDFSLGVVWDLMNRKGKAIRPILTVQLGDLLGVDRKLSLPVAFLVETVHNSTLIIDDIEDNSEFRRGDKCVHLKYGVDNSINSGCLGYFLPVSSLLSHFKENGSGVSVDSRLALSEIYLEEMKNIHLGLAWDIYWHSKHHSVESLPTEADYLRMVESKTSVLLRIGFRMIAELAHRNKKDQTALMDLANKAGASFQIKDDLINLTEGDYRGKGAGIGDDITEGKITLMVIEHVRRTKDQRLLDLLARKTKDQTEIKGAIKNISDSGALQYAELRQRQLMEQARNVLGGLSGNTQAKQDMDDVLADLLVRKN